MKRLLLMALIMGLVTSVAHSAVADEEEPRVKIVEEPQAKEQAGEDVAEPTAPGVGAWRPWSSQGAEIIPLDVYAFDGSVGWPGLGATFHFPILEDFELAPSFAFFWALAHDVGAVGDTFTLQMKYLLMKTGAISLSLRADVGLGLVYNRNINVFFRLSLPQLVGTYRINDKMAFHLGLKLYFDVFVKANLWKDTNSDPGAGFVIPILFNVGFEYALLRNLNIFSTLDIGPAVFTGKKVDTKVEVYPNFLIGVSYLF